MNGRKSLARFSDRRIGTVSSPEAKVASLSGPRDLSAELRPDESTARR